MNAILFLLAHNDDEIFIYEVLKRHHLEGCNIHIAYLTYDSKHGERNNIRECESLNLFTKLGISKNNLFFLGKKYKIEDGHLYEHIDHAYKSIVAELSHNQYDRIYTLAWEGGHHDHDATHLISMAFAKLLRISQVYEFSLYNSYKTFKNLFRVMHLPEKGIAHKTTTVKLSILEGINNLKNIFYFPSQKKTFLGLFPGMFFNFIIRKKIKYRRVSNINYYNKPYEGELFYERRFRIPFATFSLHTHQFIRKHFNGGRS